jgi:hypothetical protein
MHDWNLFAFVPIRAGVFQPPGRPADELSQAVDAFEKLRLWIAENPAQSSREIPGITAKFFGTIFAGRRECLTEEDQAALARFNEELSGVRVRTYDSLIDAAVAIDETRSIST